MGSDKNSDVLTINGSLVDDRWVVALHGELDMASSEMLFDAAMTSDAAVTGVVVDLTEVTFVDPVGLHALVTAQLALAATGRTLSVVGAIGGVNEVLQLSGMAEYLDVPFLPAAGLGATGLAAETG